MRNAHTTSFIAFVTLILVTAYTYGQAETRVSNSQNWGKTGMKSLTDAIDLNAALSETGGVKVATATTTNNATLTPAAQWTIVTPTGEANNGTNTVTLPTPYTADRQYSFTVAVGATNTLKFADNGTVLDLGADVVLSAGQTLTILTTGTNSAVKVSAVDGTLVANTAAITLNTSSNTTHASDIAGIRGATVNSATLTTTNGQAVVLSAQVTIITPTGEANNGTNIVTLALPYTVDRQYTIVIATGVTNLFRLADDGATMALGSDVELDATDMVELLMTSTNTAVKTAFEDN